MRILEEIWQNWEKTQHRSGFSSSIICGRTKIIPLNVLEKDSEIVELRNKVSNLYVRLTEQEIYSSKDSIITENIQFNFGKHSLSEHAEQFCLFSEKIVGYKTFPSRYKACH